MKPPSTKDSHTELLVRQSHDEVMHASKGAGVGCVGGSESLDEDCGATLTLAVPGLHNSSFSLSPLCMRKREEGEVKGGERREEVPSLARGRPLTESMHLLERF